MRLHRILALIVFALLAVSARSEARPFKPPTLIDAVRGTGYTIPAAWSGIWQYEDSTYQCTPRVLTGTDSGLDTLCAGTSFEPDTTEGINYDCTGTVTDTFVDITCTGAIKFEGCSATFETRSIGNRTGETFIATTTISTTWTPPGCAFQPNTCEQIVSRNTRIAPQPEGCATPALQGTWGALKSRYR